MSSNPSDEIVDLARLRADTPGVDEVIHFNNAGSSLPPRPVVEDCIRYLEREATIGGYETAVEYGERLDALYPSIARLLNAHPDEIAFTTSAAQAWWRSFEAVPLAAGDRVLISSTEYQANAFGLLQAADRGVSVELIPSTGTGELDLEALETMLDGRVKMVAVTQISLSNGMVQPVAAVGALVADHPALYVLDACQAAGQLPLDVEAIGCDFLSFTGRKFMRGPRGTGALWVRGSLLEEADALAPPSHIDGRSALWTDPTSYELAPTALRYEYGEVSYAAKLGFATAVDYALEVGLDTIAERNRDLAARLRGGLAEIDGVTVTDQGTAQCAIVTFTIDGQPSPQVSEQLRSRWKINTSAPPAANALLDIGRRGIDAVVRAAVHYFMTTDEVDALIEAVQILASE